MSPNGLATLGDGRTRSVIGAAFAAFLLGGMIGLVGPAIAAAALLAPVVLAVCALGVVYLVSRPEALMLPVASFSLVLLSLPVLFENSKPLRLACVGLLVVVAAVAWAQPARRALSVKSAVFVGLFLVLLGVTLLRGSLDGSYNELPSALADIVQFAALTALAIGMLRSADSQTALNRRYVAIATAPAIYIGANLLLLVLGHWFPIPKPEQESLALGSESQTLALLGIHTTRVELPLAQSINNVGVVAAGGLVAGAMLAIRTPRAKVIGVAAASVCAVGILLSDTRTALVIAVVVIVLMTFWPRGRWAKWIVMLLPFSPYLVPWATERLASLGLVESLSRQGSDLLTGSQRFIIWNHALETIWHPRVQGDWVNSAVIQLFGWGANGHIASGAAEEYEFLFRSQQFRLVSAHNIAIQTVLDSGLVGLAVFIAVALVVVGALRGAMARAPSSPVAAIFGMTVVLLAGGITEVVPTYISTQAMMMLCLIFGCAIVRVERGGVAPPTGSAAEEDPGRHHSVPRRAKAPPSMTNS